MKEKNFTKASPIINFVRLTGQLSSSSSRIFPVPEHNQVLVY